MNMFEEAQLGLGNAAEEALKDVRARWKDFNQHEGVVESFQRFVAAVDWSVGFCCSRFLLRAFTSPNSSAIT